MTKNEALNIAIDYMNERFEEHDAKFQRHPVAEAERNNILADIQAIKEALAQTEQDWSMLEAMQGSLREHMARIKELESQRKPLTDEEKDRLANAWFLKDGDTDVAHRKAIALIEEVEAAHGIKGEA